MRNSLLPIILMLLVSALTVPLLMRSPARGAGGPDVNAGVYRKPVKALHQVESAALEGVDEVRDATGEAGFAVRRVVVVSGSDRGPLTRAAMYGLAERITEAGGVAILDPARVDGGDTDHVLALGAAWSVRIGTVDGKPPEVPGHPCEATLACRAADVRVPDDHPAARLQRDGRLRARSFTLAHRSRGEAGDWPSWYAGVGRRMADAILAELGAGAPADADLTVPDWGSGLPHPPQTEVLRWRAALQHELVRGWVGRIDGLSTIDRAGAHVPSLGRLEKVLERGEWRRAEAAPAEGQGAAYTLWQRDRDGGGWLAVRSDAGGHDVAVWWERERPAELFDGWLDALGSGEEPPREREARLSHGERAPAAPTAEAMRAQARTALERHLGCDAIPSGFRERARAALAAAPAAATTSATAAAPR